MILRDPPTLCCPLAVYIQRDDCSSQCKVPPDMRAQQYTGALDFQANIGPLTKEQWLCSRSQHCVDGAELPYGDSTYAWQFVNARWFHTD